jgi:hypothetical protein
MISYNVLKVCLISKLVASDAYFVWNVWCCGVSAFVWLHAYICYYLPAIDSKENECTEEGKVLEY